MKKSLMLISFAFIFLLSVSVVSANFFDWITGDVGSRTIQSPSIPKSIDKSDGTTNTFSRTSRVSATSSQRRSSISNGWREVERADGKGKCYILPEKSEGLLGLVRR